MNNTILVPLPPEMEPFRDDLSYFFQSMVRKLHANRHKGTSKQINLDLLHSGLMAEIVELETAKGQFDATLEAADVANYAFLIAITIWNMTRAEWEEHTRDLAPNKTWANPGECVAPLRGALPDRQSGDLGIGK